ncbi:TAR DNA-binding protein 43-like isoform X2 [Mizuhopecten yessoensis]|uniref:TAR DNA-binding protein 43-like isoform X2 n=1 Tax=Mizuhopecten yessoensis TaxID=6573 RepID=UPI000B45E2B5|nr:TAR DNA-binding protein 43-like isoform X2 [Mizuhopecten yessoensis]
MTDAIVSFPCRRDSFEDFSPVKMEDTVNMSDYISVSENESDEAVEIPREEDGTLLLSTLSAQYPGACGLKFRNPATGNFRGVRLIDGKLHPPDSAWGNDTYIVVFPRPNSSQSEIQETENQIHHIQSLGDNKRKGDDMENPVIKTKRVETRNVCSDLIVLGLPWKATEEDVKAYFTDNIGEVVLAQVKRDAKGNSKGFGFIRFSSYKDQLKCLQQRHMIMGRWCDVNIPNSNETAQRAMNSKIFVARCSEKITVDDLRTYFAKFGEVTDVFIPRPFRSFAFVTFQDALVAQSLCGEDHIICGCSVHLSSAAPKTNSKMGGDRQGGFRGNDFGRGGGMGMGMGMPQGGGGGGGGQGQGWGGQRGNRPQGNPGGGDGNDNMGMNFLNMMAAAQAVLSGQGGWGPLGMGGQNNSNAEPSMGQPFNQSSPRPDSGNNQRSFSGWGGGSSGGGSGSGGTPFEGGNNNSGGSGSTGSGSGNSGGYSSNWSGQNRWN